MKKGLLSVFALLLLASCSLKQNVSVYKTYPVKEKVQIVHAGQTLPQGLMRIGSITVGDTGFTFTSLCTYEACMHAITSRAAEVGADLVYIVHIKEPKSDVGGSSCYNITADLYVYDDKTDK